MGSLFKKSSPPPGPGREPPEGAEHRKLFPLACQMGDDGNTYLGHGLHGRAQQCYLKVMDYLVGKGLIDQFLLGKAYLGLLMVAALHGGDDLRDLVDGSSGSRDGPMAAAYALLTPARHCFKTPILAPQDHMLYHDLCDFARGRASTPPQNTMAPWDLRLASLERFPVLLLARRTVVTVLEKASPPQIVPELEGSELFVEVPGLGID